MSNLEDKKVEILCKVISVEYLEVEAQTGRICKHTRTRISRNDLRRQNGIEACRLFHREVRVSWLIANAPPGLRNEIDVRGMPGLVTRARGEQCALRAVQSSRVCE